MPRQVVCVGDSLEQRQLGLKSCAAFNNEGPARGQDDAERCSPPMIESGQAAEGTCRESRWIAESMSELTTRDFGRTDAAQEGLRP